MRAAGATWREIAHRLDMSRNTVIERGRRIQATLCRTPSTPGPVAPMQIDDANRSALPAGHALTWGLISAAPYPG